MSAGRALFKSHDINDLLQMCAIKLWQSKKKYGKSESDPAQVVRITRNLVTDIIRRQRTDLERINYESVSLDEEIKDERTGKTYSCGETIPADGVDLFPHLILEEKVLSEMRFEAALRKLTPLQRKICKHLAEDYTLKEIARLVGKSERTIRREVTKIKAGLKEGDLIRL